MAKNQGPRSLSEAIETLENAGSSKAQDFRKILENDYEKLQQALEDLRPHLEGLKDQVEHEVLKKKDDVESQVRENPWMTLGLVGLFAFVIGLFFGTRRK